MNEFFKDKSVLVTGGSGFLGKHLVQGLINRSCSIIYTPSSSKCNLMSVSDINDSLDTYKPNIIIHLAAKVGGIGANQKSPGDFFYKNLMMGINLIECSKNFNIKKLVIIGSVCSFPKFTPIPFKEEDLWNGYPEETNAPYGIAKKAILVCAQAYRQQFGLNSIFLMPVNLYGPGDNFDLNTSHVIPAIIRKCLEAKKSKSSFVELWGDGSASREFLYVEDAVNGILLATENYNDQEPINIGNGHEINIGDLASRIAYFTGFNGKIMWNKSRPNGQPRRCLDVSKAKNLFGFSAKTGLDDGLKKTIDWYLKNEKN
jgi:GDP-L-fucose synthase